MLVQQSFDGQKLIGIGRHHLGQDLAHIRAMGGGEIHLGADQDASERQQHVQCLMHSALLPITQQRRLDHP